MSKKKERMDSEKIFANWNKTLGLFERDEHSLAIVRAAVTVELAANIIVRAELVEKRNLPAEFVDSLLKWANGIAGKFDRLIYPILRTSPNYRKIRALDSEWKKINKERNSVAHSGEFKTRRVAEDIVSGARRVLQTMTADYEPNLKFGKTQSEHRKLHSSPAGTRHRGRR